jgi:hypothetical protein
MTPTPEELQVRAEIRDVLMRYFHGADRGEVDVVRNCFTEDVCAQYEGRPAVRGVDALMAQIALFANLENGSCTVATHFAGNLVFGNASAEFAETENNVLACLVSATGPTVAIRSLRYLDRLKRVNGEWKIFARIHTLDWSCELPATFARPFPEKISTFPPGWPLS